MGLYDKSNLKENNVPTAEDKVLSFKNTDKTRMLNLIKEMNVQDQDINDNYWVSDFKSLDPLFKYVSVNNDGSFKFDPTQFRYTKWTNKEFDFKVTFTDGKADVTKTLTINIDNLAVIKNNVPTAEDKTLSFKSTDKYQIINLIKEMNVQDKDNDSISVDFKALNSSFKGNVYKDGEFIFNPAQFQSSTWDNKEFNFEITFTDDKEEVTKILTVNIDNVHD